MLTAIARFSVRKRWTVLAVWVVALFVATAANSAFGGEWTQGGRLDGTESQRAYDLLSERIPSQTGASATVVFAVNEGVATKKTQITSYLNEMKAQRGVETIHSPFDTDGQISEQGNIAYATIELTPTTAEVDHTTEVVERLRAKADALRQQGVTTEFSGYLFTEGELPASEIFGLLAAAVILLIAFGSIVAAGLPILTAILGIGIGLAGVGLWAAVVDTPDFTVQVASMIGIGVGIDYALFIVTRFREAKSHGKSVDDSIIEAASTAGRAVVFAGLTVVVSLLGMLLMRLDFLTGLALGSSTAVLIAVMAASTLLPALLSITGKRISPMKVRAHNKQSFWEGWSHLLQRRAIPAAVLGFVALFALAAPTLALRLGEADEGSAPKDKTTRKAYDLLAKGFTPGFAGPFIMVADLSGSDGAPISTGPTTMTQLADVLRTTDGVAFASEPQISEDGRTAVLTAISTTSPQDEKTAELLHRLRADVIPALTTGTDTKVYIGGSTASNADFSEVIGQRLPYFIGAVLLISFLLLMAMFRSVLVPLKAVILNLLSIGAAYGVMVAVFQWGWAGSLFGVDTGAPIAPWAPMMLFAIVFGLSMDYEVFLLSKIRERYDQTGDNSLAVAEGVAGTARVISAAAAIMVFVFGFFVFGENREIKLIGLGLATAVFIDATVVRLILVPATMELLGARNWWLPAWLDRVLPHLDIEGHHDPEGTDHPGGSSTAHGSANGIVGVRG